MTEEGYVLLKNEEDLSEEQRTVLSNEEPICLIASCRVVRINLRVDQEKMFWN